MAEDDLQSNNAAVGETEPAAPITSRFLFVDVAAQRAKQLRRGALARLDRGWLHSPHKLERVAMEEVRSGLTSTRFLPTTKARRGASARNKAARARRHDSSAELLNNHSRNRHQEPRGRTAPD